jgi:hypothetical protein
MRVYVRVSDENALKILSDGFWDLHSDLHQEGVYCDAFQADGVRPAPGSGAMIGGPSGPTVLCTDVPESVFRELESQESTRSLTKEEGEHFRQTGKEPAGLEYQRMGYAIIPAAVLNQFGRPQVYTREYCGMSRADLLKLIQAWEQQGEPETQDHAEELRATITFLDQIGWNTPLERDPELDFHLGMFSTIDVDEEDSDAP